MPRPTSVHVAAMGVVLVAVMLVGSTSVLQGRPEDLVAAGTDAAGQLVRQDIPHARLLAEVGQDGRFFYAIARDFPDLVRAPILDQPRRREQRILFPAVARLLEPFGVGRTLVWSLILVNLLGVALCCWVVAQLATRWDASVWWGLTPVIFPGAVAALRIGTPDVLALGLVLLSVLLLEREKVFASTIAGMAAGLTRETMLIILGGYLLAKRSMAAWTVTMCATGAVASWWFALRVLLPGKERSAEDFGWFRGVRFVLSHGLASNGLILAGEWCAITAVLLGLAATLRRGPLRWACAGYLVLILLLGPSPLVTFFNSVRIVLPLVVCSILSLVGRRPSPVP